MSGAVLPGGPPDLPAVLRSAGFHPVGPTGAGRSGVRWSARGPDGSRWVVTVVSPGSPAQRSELEERLARLARLVQPHLPRVGPPLELGDGGLAVLHEDAPGTDLETVRQARARWSHGEVVTVLVPLAGALAALHDAGLAHGDVSPANVVLSTDGRPVLVDVVGGDRTEESGTPGYAAPERSEGAAPPGDVHALAALGLRLLGMDPAVPDDPSPGAPGALVAHLRAACVPNPQARPSASRLAEQVYGACPAEAVQMPDPAVLARTTLRRLAERSADEVTARTPVVKRRRARHRRPRRRAPLVAGVGGVALVGALVVSLVGSWSPDGRGEADVRSGAEGAQATPGVHGAGPGSAAEPAGPTSGVRSAGPRSAAQAEGPTSAAQGAGPISPSHGGGTALAAAGQGSSPVAAAVDLTTMRARALADGDLAALRRVTVPGSPAAAADVRAVEQARSWPAGTPPHVRIDGARLLPPSTGTEPDCSPCARVALAATVSPDPSEANGPIRAEGHLPADGAAGRPARWVVLVMQQTADGWRVRDVQAHAP